MIQTRLLPSTSVMALVTTVIRSLPTGTQELLMRRTIAPPTNDCWTGSRRLRIGFVPILNFFFLYQVPGFQLKVFIDCIDRKLLRRGEDCLDPMPIQFFHDKFFVIAEFFRNGFMINLAHGICM